MKEVKELGAIEAYDLGESDPVLKLKKLLRRLRFLLDEEDDEDEIILFEDETEDEDMKQWYSVFVYEILRYPPDSSFDTSVN